MKVVGDEAGYFVALTCFMLHVHDLESERERRVVQEASKIAGRVAKILIATAPEGAR
jgi:hypothetical protein